MTTYCLTRRDTGAQAFVTVVRMEGRTAYAVRCPWHSEETASCGVSSRSHLFYCFTCGVCGTCHEGPPDIPVEPCAYCGLPAQSHDALAGGLLCPRSAGGNGTTFTRKETA
jgi:hypothetical protein